MSEVFPKPGTPEWGRMNARRHELIAGDLACTLTEQEQIELAHLQEQTRAALNEAFPNSPIDEERLRRLEDRLAGERGSRGMSPPLPFHLDKAKAGAEPKPEGKK
jgi:hypothetical protein